MTALFVTDAIPVRRKRRTLALGVTLALAVIFAILILFPISVQ